MSILDVKKKQQTKTYCLFFFFVNIKSIEEQASMEDSRDQCCNHIYNGYKNSCYFYYFQINLLLLSNAKIIRVSGNFVLLGLFLFNESLRSHFIQCNVW